MEGIYTSDIRRHWYDGHQPLIAVVGPRVIRSETATELGIPSEAAAVVRGAPGDAPHHVVRQPRNGTSRPE